MIGKIFYWGAFQISGDMSQLNLKINYENEKNILQIISFTFLTALFCSKIKADEIKIRNLWNN